MIVYACSKYLVLTTKVSFHRDNFVNALSQWETTLLCNIVSHWQGAYTKWSLFQSNGDRRIWVTPWSHWWYGISLLHGWAMDELLWDDDSHRICTIRVSLSCAESRYTWINHVDRWVQERHKSSVLAWSYVFLALTHGYMHVNKPWYPGSCQTER